MSHFFVRACPNGHYEIDYKPARKEDVCRVCGEHLTHICPECGGVIKEWIFYGASMMPPKAEGYDLPDKCPACGALLPWHGKQKRRVGNSQGR